MFLEYPCCLPLWLRPLHQSRKILEACDCDDVVPRHALPQEGVLRDAAREDGGDALDAPFNRWIGVLALTVRKVVTNCGMD
jgi:hypothetical protein